MLSVKQRDIKYYFFSLWYDSTWDWTLSSVPLANTLPLGQLAGQKNKSGETNKKTLDYSYKKRLEKLSLTPLLERRIRDDLIKTSKIINKISYSSWHFLQKYFSSKGKLTIDKKV